MSKATTSIAGATFPELLEQLWQARHDGDVLVRFSGGKPQYIELLQRERLRCVDTTVSCARGVNGAAPPLSASRP